MPVCAWFNRDAQNCTHTANLTGRCPTAPSYPPSNLYSPCNSIYLLGKHQPWVKIQLNCRCKECGTRFTHDIFKKYQQPYDNAIKRGLIVCCNCHVKRLHELIHGDWTEDTLIKYQEMWAFAESHPEIILEQSPEDWV